MDKVQVMLELESRGALPPEKQAIINELRNRGAIPAISNQQAPSRDLAQEARDKELYRKNFPEMAAQDAATTPTSRAVNEVRASRPTPGPSGWGEVGLESPLNQPPSFTRKGTSGAGLTPVPEWRQTAMEAVNKLPEIGSMVGTAAGMAGVAAGAPMGAEALSPWVVPGTAAAGRTIGRVAQTPLQQLLLPESNAQYPTGGELSREAMTGAAEGAAAALPIPGVEKYPSLMAEKGPAATLDELILSAQQNDPTRDVRQSIADALSGRSEKLYRRVMRPSPSGSPEENLAAIKYGAANRVNLLKGQEGLAPIEENISKLGAKSTALAEGAPGRVAASDVLKSVDEMKSKFNLAGSDRDTIDNVIADFMKRYPNPDQTFSAAEAEGLKREAYAKVMGKDFVGETYNPTKEAYKGLGRGFRKETEKAVGNPEYSQTNKQLSEAMNFREKAIPATERIANQNLPSILRQGPKRQQATSSLYSHLSDIIRPGEIAPEVEAYRPPLVAPEVMPTPADESELYYQMANQQMQPNVPTPESVPGTLMEGEVPRTGFTQPEGYGQVQPGISSYSPEMNRPVQVMPDTENYPGTLMEGEVPWSLDELLKTSVPTPKNPRMTKADAESLINLEKNINKNYPSKGRKKK